MKTIIRINRETKVDKLLFITLIAIVFVIAGCSKSEENSKTIKGKEYWTCTMHPQVISDKPGTCPICGMDLVKKVSDESEHASSKNQNDMEGMLSLNNRKQVLANISTVKVKKENLDKEIAVYSYLDFVENNRKTISARFNGRIEKMFIDKTGDYIHKGQPLFEIYSSDLVLAQNEYLIALSNSNQEKKYLLTAAEKKLKVLGLTENQIKEIENTRQAKLTVTYFSPVSGTVIEKKVQEGMYVNEGSVIYDIAELSFLWNIAEVNENNLSAVKVGSKVKLHLNAYPGEEFTGKVSFIYPVVNQQTRTVKIRSEFPNYKNKLKPQMYGETIFSSSNGLGILIPADAVVFTGRKNVVWIKVKDGMFEAREVNVGQRYKDKYQILSGLNEGDEIAATGGFLIDSESQLKTGTNK